MLEILMQRKAELEIAAKNAIIETYLIEEQIASLSTMFESKKRFLKDVNASLHEIEHMIGLNEPEKEVENKEIKK